MDGKILDKRDKDMNIRIYNVRILTMEAGKGIFRGEVWVKGDKIAYAGPVVMDAKETWDREKMCIRDRVNAVLFEGKNPAEAVDELMLREQKSEHLALPWPDDK